MVGLVAEPAAAVVSGLSCQHAASTSAAMRKPILPALLSGVFALRAAQR